MASKKDLVEGQSFSRRRLITAFVSGAPGGREVEPGKPLRAVVGGVVLSAILVVGALAAGLLAPTLPDGWDQDSLVIAEDTGARYVALDGTLFPVINTASARLLIPSNYKVVSAKADKLTKSKRGATLGIIGAPDAMPTTSGLIDSGWTACTSRARGLATTISRTPLAKAVTDQAVVARVDGGAQPVTYLIDNGIRYLIPAASVNSVKLVLGLATAPDYSVTAAWVNLFAPGPDLAPFSVDGKGDPPTGQTGLPATARVGSVVADEENPDQQYLLLSGGRIAPLKPFAAAMYRLGGTVGDQDAQKIAGQVFSGLTLAPSVSPQAWPSVVPTAVDRTACAILTAGTGGTKPSVSLGVAPGSPPADNVTSTTVDPGAGALIRAIGAANLVDGPVFLVDQTGSAFPVVSSGDDDAVARLGYAQSDVVPVPSGWAALLTTGATLSVAGARTVVAAAAGK